MSLTKLPFSLFYLGCLLFVPALCAEEASVEYKIKAGYLYNFTKFITWPYDNERTFNLCIVGDDPFGEIINPIEQRSAMDRRIKLIRQDHYDAKIQCHILFNNRLEELPTGKHAILTVGDAPEFAHLGGMIGFANKEGRIKLQINLRAIKSSGLEISAKLLEVSELIAGNNHD